MSLSRDALIKLLRDAAEQGATEVHFKVPQPPLFRIGSSLIPTKLEQLTPRDTQEAVFLLCSLAQLELPLAQVTDKEFSFGLHRVGRFRAHIYRQRGSLSAVVQRVATQVPTLHTLGLDAEAEKNVGRPGIVLLSGRRRNDLMAALISGFNARSRGHVVVLESPLTYLYRDAMATIAHREVGVDVPDFQTGIRQAIRVGSDLLAVGEVATPSDAEAVLTAAEREIPVIACVPATRADLGMWWITRMFFGEHREVVERRLQGQLLTSMCAADGPPEVLAFDAKLREVG